MSKNKVGRNLLCPCGSGLKYKKCCYGKYPLNLRKYALIAVVAVLFFSGAVFGSINLKRNSAEYSSGTGIQPFKATVAVPAPHTAKKSPAAEAVFPESRNHYGDYSSHSEQGQPSFSDHSRSFSVHSSDPVVPYGYPSGIRPAAYDTSYSGHSRHTDFVSQRRSYDKSQSHYRNCQPAAFSPDKNSPCNAHNPAVQFPVEPDRLINSQCKVNRHYSQGQENEVAENFPENRQFRMEYDAENRLKAHYPENPENGDKKTEFVYDYMGRRVSKKVSVRSGREWISESEKLFVYNGNEVVEEITKKENKESSKYYVWGPDISQTRGNAGGIGGLIASVEDDRTNYFFYDGIGNVGQLVDPNLGEIVAKYSYDPFGNIVGKEGPEADSNPFRFSTKYHDDETGLVYFERRYYLPALGRWTTRDPAEENGGLNLYSYAINNPTNLIDPFGLKWTVNRNSSSAQAVAEGQCGDTIAELSELIGLSSADYRNWIDPIDGLPVTFTSSEKLRGNRKYHVPNTIAAYWAGAMGDFGKDWVFWDENIDYLKNQGFEVAEFDHVVGDLHSLHRILPSYANNKELHGLYFWGHGYAPSKNTGLSAGLVSHEGDDEVLKYSTFNIPYKMAIGLMFACYTNHGKHTLSSNAPGHIWFGTDAVLNPVTLFKGKLRVEKYVPANAHSAK